MCYREDWFYGWTENDMARKRAELKAKHAKAAKAATPHQTPSERERTARLDKVEIEAEEIV